MIIINDVSLVQFFVLGCKSLGNLSTPPPTHTKIEEVSESMNQNLYRYDPEKTKAGQVDD